jgi:hypothetical protein
MDKEKQLEAKRLSEAKKSKSKKKLSDALRKNLLRRKAGK